MVTDGIFSMRGDHAPLAEIEALARRYDSSSMRTSCWWSTTPTASEPSVRRAGAPRSSPARRQVDILVATLGKALGVNGGYVVG